MDGAETRSSNALPPPLAIKASLSVRDRKTYQPLTTGCGPSLKQVRAGSPRSSSERGAPITLHCDETYTFPHVALFPEGDSQAGIEGNLILTSPSVGSSTAFLRFLPAMGHHSATATHSGSPLPSEAENTPGVGRERQGQEVLLSSGEEESFLLLPSSPGGAGQSGTESYAFTVSLRNILVIKRSISPAGHSVILVTLHGGVNLLPLHFLSYTLDASSIASGHRIPPFLSTFAKFAILTPSEPDPNIIYVDFPKFPPESPEEACLQVVTKPYPSSSESIVRRSDMFASGDLVEASWNPAWGLLGTIRGLATSLLPSALSSYLPESALSDARPFPDRAPDAIVDEFEDIVSQGSPNPLFLNNLDTHLPRMPEPVPRGPPLSSGEWRAALDAEGRIKADITELRRRLFLGGLAPDVRHQVWPFLLGVYPWDSTARERAQLLREAHEEYHTYKAQWSSMTPKQRSQFKAFREVASIIKKDVHRTDRDLPFFGDASTLEKLEAILLSYAMFNFDLGYGQGMNDLLSPILVVFAGDEVLSFACFAKFMEAQQRNFAKDPTFLRMQVEVLGKVLAVLDPELHIYLGQIDAWDSFFPVRWFLCHFKREFPIHETMMIWEAFWSDWLHNPIIHIFFSAALLLRHRDDILEDRPSQDQLLQFVNALAGSLSVEDILIRTHHLHNVFWNVVRPTECQTILTSLIDSL